MPTPRHLLLAAAAAGLLTAVAIFLLDVPIARAVMALDPTPWRRALRVVEIVTLLDQPKFVVGASLALLGGLTLFWRRPVGRALLYVGLTHLATRYVAGTLKLPLGRHRPNETPFDPSFFHPDGIAFPSGHTAHIFGLAVALLVVWPRSAWVTAPLGFFVIAARVVPNDHWLGDTLGSLVVALVVGALLWPIARRD